MFIPKVAVEVHAPVISYKVPSRIESQNVSHQLFKRRGEGIEDGLFFTGEHAPVFFFIDKTCSQVPFQVAGIGAKGIDGVQSGLPALGDASIFVPLEEYEGFGEEAFPFEEFAIFFVVIAEESGPDHGEEAIGGSDCVGAVVVKTGEPFKRMFFGSIEEGGIG